MQIATFELDHSAYPGSPAELVRRPAWVTRDRWRPYLAERPRDGWGRELVYRREGLRFVILSAGPDGREGTRDDLVYRPPTCEHDGR